ncbi:MAG: SusF/SusE family outer membrane protein, partial [Chitinophagaceae bacterium]|nr:SusF/SusE family outer membrane protein [Chitinophagaceae bacterium]
MKYLCILLFFALFNSAAFCQVSIIGAATPAANWNTDVDLVETGTGTNIWTGTFALSASELKFRRNRSWDPANNWGGASFPNGAAVPNGANIVVATAGVYAISLNLNTLTYTFTLVPASNLGINTTSPNQRLHVEGKLKIGDDPNPPTAGTVRWNEATKDFEGYDGTVWRSLTRTNSANWGANDISQKENQKGSVFNVGVVDVYKGMGNSVSSSGFNFLAGAPVSVTSGQTGRGKASIFTEGTNTNWDLQAADGAAGERFGSSVSISGDYAVVGANFADISGREEQGAAYVFRRASSTQWLQEAKITAPDGTAYDYFGHSVSISGNTIVVGAYGHEFGPNASQGAAYVFTRSGTTWPLQAKLIASDGSSSDNFGNSVSIAGDYVIVGTAGDDVDG